jgi:tetratricopeptide (TPR) repeat protein
MTDDVKAKSEQGILAGANVKGNVTIGPVTQIMGQDSRLTDIDVTLDANPPPYHHWQVRQEEAQILADLVTGRQLVEVIGIGGYGKSALAARAFEQATGFDKKLWVSFRPLFSEQEFPPFNVFGRWLGRAFGYQPAPTWTDEQLATEALNRLGRERCLLVLDNLETLLTADGQWLDLGYRDFLLRWFGTGGQGVTVVTSRERPDLPSNTLGHTRLYAIGGLPIEAGVSLLRAQQVQGTEAELKEYVVVADGHPLLLNLTVGFLKNAAGDSPPISVLKRSDFNFFETVGLHRGDPQTSIEIILSATLRRLDEDLLQVLFSIWAFPMPFTQILLRVARDSTATEAQLRQLAKRSLLQETYRQGWTFQFQPLIRTYLQEQLLNFYRTTDNRLGEANTLIAIGDVLQFLKRSTEALANYEQAIGIYREVGDRLGEANTLKAIGDVLQFLDRRTEALANYEQAIGIYREVGDRLGEANTLKAIGDVLQFLKRSTEALANYEQAIGIYREVGARLGEANTLKAIGDVLQFLDRRTEALANYEQAIGIYREVGARLGEANTLKAIGDVLQFLDRRTEALANYEQAIGIYREVGARLGEANTLIAIGDVLQFLDRRTEALANYEQAIGIYREVGARLGEANTLKAIGDVLQFLDRRTEALANYEQAIGIYREVGDRLGEANTLKAIGDVLQFLDRRTEALANYEQAMGFYREVGACLGEANVLQELGKLNDDPQSGLDSLNRAQAIYQQIGDQYSQSRNCLFIADRQLQLRNPDAAIQTLQQAAALAAAINYEPFQEYAIAKIAELQQPPTSRWLQMIPLFRLKGWHYIVLGLLALMLVLVIQWIRHR